METALKVEVLAQRNDLSIISTDDTTGEQVETTLTPEEAWKLVADLNAAILRLLPSTVQKDHSKNKVSVTININGVLDEALLQQSVQKALTAIHQETMKKPMVQAAVLSSIGADQKRERHLPPGDPRTIPIAGLRETEL